MDRQMTMLGHVLRRDSEDLIRRVTCDSNLRRPTVGYRRVGQPRGKWLDDNLHRTWNHINTGPQSDFDPNNEAMISHIVIAANNRDF